MGGVNIPPDKSDHGETQGGAGNGDGKGDQVSEVQDGKMSYSDRLKTNVRYDQRLKRNVLEITLEKTDTEAELDDVDQEAIARVFKTLGIDIVTQVQGYQVHYKGKISIISVWMGAGISLDRFCKDINIKVVNGVMTGMIRPAGKKDVTVTVAGLDFNTPDNFVVDYLNKFGTVMSNAVIYSKFDMGPFRGKYTGERKYQVDFSKATRQMGTYHLIDGSKVRLFYRGNKKTCGRCHKLANECPGEAVARNCAVGGGARVFLSDHMKKLWEEIGFAPTTFELDESDKTEDDIQQAVKDAPIITETRFPPIIQKQQPNDRDIDNLDGITVKNFPSNLDDKEIHTFLLNYGMPLDHGIEHIKIVKGGKNTWVVVDGLCSSDIQTMFDSIHFPATKQKFFDVPLYCKTLRNMTPLKKSASGDPVDIPEQTEKKKLENNPAKADNDDSEKNEVKIQEQVKPKIPGLPEEERLKIKKKKKNKQKKEKKKASNLSVEDFLISPRTGLINENTETEDYVFSDYQSDNSDESDNDEAFEDSKETFSEDEKESAPDDPFTPVNLKSAFARRYATLSVAKPTSTPSSMKRSASSPAEKVLPKKTRPQSLIPKKK